MTQLDNNQQQRAIEAMKSWLNAPPMAEGLTSWDAAARLDAQRHDLIEKVLRPLVESYLAGKTQLADFKSQVDGLNKQNRYWGFRGVKGQMFFNMVVKTAEATNTGLNECAQELKSALLVPSNEDMAKNRIRRFESYAKRLGDDRLKRGGNKQGRPQTASVPYFLSYFWQIQDKIQWPVYYTNDVQVLGDLNLWTPTDDLGDSYINFKHLYEELVELFTKAGGKPFTYYHVEHVFWFKGGNPLRVSEPPESGKKENAPAPSVAVAPASDGKLPDSYIPPIVAILPQLAVNAADLSEAAKASGTSLEHAFEKSINAAFTILGYETKLLGQGKGRVPDGHALDSENSYAILWDAKARSEGYNMGTDDRAIHEYITNQSKELMKRGSFKNIYYAIISSHFQDDFDDAIRTLKMDTVIREVVLLEADALVAMVDKKLRDPVQIKLGSEGIQRLFTSSGILRADEVRESLG